MSTLVTSGSALPHQWLSSAPSHTLPLLTSLPTHTINTPSPMVRTVSAPPVRPPSPLEANVIAFWKSSERLNAFVTCAMEICRDQKISVRHFENHLDSKVGTVNIAYLLLHHRLTCQKLPTDYLQVDQLKKIWRELIRPHLYIADSQVTLSAAESIYDSVNHDSLAWSSSVKNVFKYFPRLSSIEQVCEIWKKIKKTIENFHFEENIFYHPPVITTTNAQSTPSSSSSADFPHAVSSADSVSDESTESTAPMTPQSTLSSTRHPSSEDEQSEDEQTSTRKRVTKEEINGTSNKRSKANSSSESTLLPPTPTTPVFGPMASALPPPSLDLAADTATYDELFNNSLNLDNFDHASPFKNDHSDFMNMPNAL